MNEARIRKPLLETNRPYSVREYANFRIKRLKAQRSSLSVDVDDF